MSRAVVASVLLLVLAAGACGGGSGSDGEIVVSAAASLTDVLTEMVDDLTADRPRLEVILNLGGSSALREQILAGAAVDVFAPAAPGDMYEVEAAGLLSAPPVAFAKNRMVIAVPPGNPGQVSGLEAFADPELLIGLCQVGVPCGDLAREALDSAGITPQPDTEEPDVRSLLTKIAAGELDAGIVYASDVATGAVDAVEIPAQNNRTTIYLIAPITDQSSDSFIEYVLSDAGAAVLSRWGFLPP